MIKTFTVLVSHHFANPDPPVMMLLGTTVAGSFVWNLFEIWLLVLEIFKIFINQIIFAKAINCLSRCRYLILLTYAPTYHQANYSYNH